MIMSPAKSASTRASILDPAVVAEYLLAETEVLRLQVELRAARTNSTPPSLVIRDLSPLGR
jgi:hypothetical protein